MLARLSLRARLVLGVILLCAVGLAVADVATDTALRSFLVDRTDRSLRDSARGLERDHRRGPCGDDVRGPRGDFVQFRSADGAVLCSRQLGRFRDRVPSPPQLPATIDLPSSGDGPARAAYFTVNAKDGGDRYRVRASRESSTILIVATSLAEVDATLHRLLLIELLVTAAVLAGLAVLGLWAVRLGLRPLGAIETTAAAIAGGDLSQRVERAEPRTEVGRLGLALNAMLGQIETAFKAQSASERRLRQFVADASHELRTPLAAVRAYAELFTLGANRRPDDLARSMRGIRRESERMSVVVEDLLLLARLDEGRPLAREPIALETLVSEAVETALTVEPNRPLTYEAAHARVLGDRDRLRQIVDNLLSNVREHTPAGAPAHVCVRRENDTALIEVRDTGPGMRPEEAERVFERFYRADPSRSRASGGVGLGLAIVAAVADAHGGNVLVRSQPGEGATFQISLPLAEDANGSEDAQSQS